MEAVYGSPPPRTTGTPNTPRLNQLSYQQQTSQPGHRPGIYSKGQDPYPHRGYATSAGTMPQATTAASHPQPIALAPFGGRGPLILRPMPPSGILPQPGVASSYGPDSLMHPKSNLQYDGRGVRVVGPQGRRGMLPSAPGRPAAQAAGTGASNNIIPVKDADGKFPCPHCTKVYLHAKHLKRHLLRHTGDRPYMCVLCRDTFSRSDILKGHFEKCSVRRGNPTGASHLSHPEAHVKKNAQAQQEAALENGRDLDRLNGLGTTGGNSIAHPFSIAPIQDGIKGMASDQSQLSRSSSMGRPDNDAGRRNMAGPVMGASQEYASGVSSTMTNQQMPNYGIPTVQNGSNPNSNLNQQPGLDWSQVFQPGLDWSRLPDQP